MQESCDLILDDDLEWRIEDWQPLWHPCKMDADVRCTTVKGSPHNSKQDLLGFC